VDIFIIEELIFFKIKITKYAWWNKTLWNAITEF